jgi:RecB family endonuclease NucS
MNLLKAQKVKLSEHFDELWLQNQIEADPTILGLGDVVVLRRERRQSSGGRLDFLLHDPETETLYELEIQLGSTDESHIIRTIEYWDIESRKNPSKEHRAVIAAENITSRFFNIIYLLNRAIPIIALQLDVLKVGNDLALHFTKVLDIYEAPEDAIALGGEATDRSYWEGRANPKSMAAADAIMDLCRQLYRELRVTYNKSHIALGTQRQNFCWLHPRKKQIHCHGTFYAEESTDRARGLLEQAGLPFTAREQGELGFNLAAKDVEDKREALKQVFALAIKEYSE